MSDRGVGGRVVCAGRLVSPQPLLKDAETHTVAKRKSTGNQVHHDWINDSVKPQLLLCFAFKYAVLGCC